MLRRSALVMVIAFSAACSIGIVTWLATMRQRVTVIHVDALLRQRTPPGLSVEQVEAVLDSLNVEHSTFQHEQRVIYAVWRRTSVSLFSHTDIAARFYFGVDGHLDRYELEERTTGM